MEMLEIRVEPALPALAPLRRSLNAWLELVGMGSLARGSFVFAAHEAAANAIQRAGAVCEIVVRGKSDGDLVTVEITDDGQSRTADDPTTEEGVSGLALIPSL